MKLIREINDGITIDSPKKVYDKYLKEFADEDREHLIVLGLDTKNAVIYREIVSVGTLDAGLIHPREVFKKAIVMSCKNIILAHNHPSGDPEPSPEDIEATERIFQAGEVIGIGLLDHLIIGEDEYYSFKDSGHLD